MTLRLPIAEDGAEGEGAATLFFHCDDPIMNKPPKVRGKKRDGSGSTLNAVAAGLLWAVKLPPDLDRSQALEVDFYAGTAGDEPPGFVAWLGRAVPEQNVRRLLY